MLLFYLQSFIYYYAAFNFVQEVKCFNSQTNWIYPCMAMLQKKNKKHSICFSNPFLVGGMGSLHSVVNGIAHILMYFYYGLFAAGPRFHKDMRCKKYKTSIQLVGPLKLFIYNEMNSLYDFYCGFG